MFLILKIVDGPGQGGKLFLKTGQHMIVGRTEEADYSVPGDLRMSHVHFELNCGDEGCFVRDLNSTNGTLLNGEPITAAELNNGDELKAGQDVFSVSVVEDLDDWKSGAAGTPAAEKAGSAQPIPVVEPESEPPGPHPPPAEHGGFIDLAAAEICVKIEALKDAARDLLREDYSASQYVSVLEEQELFQDAVRFLAYALNKRGAVEWACGCARDAGGDDVSQADAAALQATQDWLLDPSEQNRRQTYTAAEELNFKTPASWAAMGAFWSEGSLAPPDSPTVPPAPDLTAKAVAGSVIMAASTKDPQQAPDKYRRFIQLGLEIGHRSAAPAH